jgi:beta-N-acetylhexosaminidase
VYAAIGADLADAGINLDLAPTVDVNTADDNPIIGTRSFGADRAGGPARGRRGRRAAVGRGRGLRQALPGPRRHGADSHLELPTVDAPLTVLRERDLPPFAAVIAAGRRRS